MFKMLNDKTLAIRLVKLNCQFNFVYWFQFALVSKAQYPAQSLAFFHHKVATPPYPMEFVKCLESHHLVNLGVVMCLQQ